ncbi:MAG: sugar phosphate isomerase/epimerase family protein [Methanothrix sp.]|jgi:sugar phosphate isomerase/epimerase|nr:sugar phosphate isomerase/epimerase [Methanothrix sp.]MDD1726506.1 sugar phosphate isomerase/epimerase [Methanothrix sp.]MDD1735198.1 sugar phosphate isomerase/epimerase [Methanothrix sp.]
MFSFSSSKLVDRPFDWAYQLKDLGYSGWEIVNEGRQKLTAESLVQAREIVETTDLVITIHLPYSDLNLASVNQPIWEETVRQMKSCLDLAGEFSRLAVLHPGHFSPLGMHMPDAAWSQSILGIQQVSDHAAELDMKVAVENMVNMPAILGRRPEEVMGIIETVDRENVGFIFDVGHANTNGNVEDFLKYSSRMIHVHVHDNHGDRDEHLPVGNGTVPWKKVAQALRDYEGRIVTESRSLEEGQRSVVRLKKLMGV